MFLSCLDTSQSLYCNYFCPAETWACTTVTFFFFVTLCYEPVHLEDDGYAFDFLTRIALHCKNIVLFVCFNTWENKTFWRSAYITCKRVMAFLFIPSFIFSILFSLEKALEGQFKEHRVQDRMRYTLSHLGNLRNSQYAYLLKGDKIYRQYPKLRSFVNIIKSFTVALSCQRNQKKMHWDSLKLNELRTCSTPTLWRKTRFLKIIYDFSLTKNYRIWSIFYMLLF